MEFVRNIWDLLWVFFWAFAFIAYLFALFSIIADIFQDRNLNGWLKAVWLIFLVFLPFLTALVYLIARGKGMAERSAERANNAKAATDAYIRETAGKATPSDEIATAKALLDSGAISQSEFETLKAKALARA
ncbi:SHOCT domain-containing protein [Mycetocola zhujimingii]|uniref:SHOCT domain-containing protein n=1 Tax=Mycetocola zhujimingii TaxID=2079792 RepID=A0A2U1TAJ9_9MICO|nr:SHOCT domain-containing protein [Mycetocola zhujimingii]AWB85463.1 hypothetical protein C3E77_01645 [Mycetocola zhujimingii]PWC04627.1 hypothetical protein DF223_14370 [Mycetocola zhujimingii]